MKQGSQKIPAKIKVISKEASGQKPFSYGKKESKKKSKQASVVYSSNSSIVRRPNTPGYKMGKKKSNAPMQYNRDHYAKTIIGEGCIPMTGTSQQTSQYESNFGTMPITIASEDLYTQAANDQLIAYGRQALTKSDENSYRQMSTGPSKSKKRIKSANPMKKHTSRA